MLEGVPQAGVTIHGMTDTLDGGNILLQERFPLEIAPDGDPIEYLRRYVAEVLYPNGVRMMAAAVAATARGPHAETVQDPVRARTHRRATYAAKGELRRRVVARREAHSVSAAGRLTWDASGP